MYTVSQEYAGRRLEFLLGRGVSQEELNAMSVEKALVVKKGKEVVAVAGLVRNKERLHSPVIFLHSSPQFYCGGELPEELKSLEVLTSIICVSNCWKGKATLRSARSVGCKHAFKLVISLSSGEVIPQVIQLEEPEEDDDELKQIALRTAFRVHLLLWGEPGSGKTWSAFQIAEEVAKKNAAEIIVIQGSPALEATDLLGMWLKKDNITWQDGALSRAFKLAASGKKVILIVDELPRIPTREQNILVAPLLPTPRGLILYNPLNGEEVVAPPGNLWVIATGNLGEGYGGRLVDHALAERFLMLEVKVPKGKLKKILASALIRKGWDVNVAEKLVALREAAEELVMRGELPVAPSLRVLLRAIELAPSPEELPKWVALCHSQVALSDSESREMWEKLVKKVLS